jgi:hypothetical protein
MIRQKMSQRRLIQQHAFVEEQFVAHLDEVEDFNVYRRQTLESLQRQTDVMDRLEEKRKQHVANIKRSILNSNTNQQHECRHDQEGRLERPQQRLIEGGGGRRDTASDDEEVEELICHHLKRTTIDQDRENFTSIEIQFKQRFEKNVRRLSWRHVQLQIMRMQSTTVSRRQQYRENDHDDRTDYDTANQNNVPWQSILSRPSHFLGLEAVGLNVHDNDLRFLILREYAGFMS